MLTYLVFSLNYILAPALSAVTQAKCKLNPPLSPSTSNT